MSETEVYLRQQIARLHREYAAAIKPYVDEIVRIRSYETVVRIEMPQPAPDPFRAFNAAEKCSPLLTQCPRCNNPHNACDGGAQPRKEAPPA